MLTVAQTFFCHSRTKQFTPQDLKQSHLFISCAYIHCIQPSKSQARFRLDDALLSAL
jgi:hypothetical protein